jgi:hypothetical protein
MELKPPTHDLISIINRYLYYMKTELFYDTILKLLG